MKKENIVAFVMENAESKEDLSWINGELVARSLKQALRDALDKDDDQRRKR